MSTNLIKKSTNDFMVYAAAVIKGRAIPSVEDQLKPVHRRILYTMAVDKLWSKNKVVKVSKVVGNVMGRFHPHGDASIEDALVRLSQNWKMRYPLVFIHGNNGSVGGDEAAAGRYIECKLTPIGDALLENTIEGIVPFVDNYDNTDREPVVLGGLFPNILCNGTEGIAVGMSCGLVPHNLNEAVDLLIATAEGKVSTVEDAMQYLQGPDFPLGGIVVDGYKLPEIYKTGQGAITLRAKAEIKGNRITFTEFPFNVDVETQILKAIKKMKVEEGYDDIDETENHMGKDGCSIVVVLRKSANPQKVLKDLYDNTPLEKTIKINQTIIHDGIPLVLNLQGLCTYYLRHQHNIFINKAKMAKAKASNTQKINEGYRKAILNIDKTIEIIRNSSSKDEASEQLIAALGVDAEQAKAILALQLGRLTKMDTHEIEQKIKAAIAEVNEQTKIITNTKYRTSLICAALQELKVKFGDNRRTAIVVEQPTTAQVSGHANAYSFLLDDGALITLDKGAVEDAFKKGGSYAKYKVLKGIDNKDCEVKVLQSDGTLSINSTDATNDSLFRIDTTKDYVVTISRKGIMKKTLMDGYKRWDRLGKVKEGDSILTAFCCNKDERIAVVQDNGKIVAVPVASIKESSKLTIGSKQTEGAMMACMISDYMFTLDKEGHVKRFKGNEITTSSSALNDNCIQIGNAEEFGYHLTTKFVKFKWSEISIKSKSSIGAKLSAKQIELII